jgi:hypothetical protein
LRPPEARCSPGLLPFRGYAPPRLGRCRHQPPPMSLACRPSDDPKATD